MFVAYSNIVFIKKTNMSMFGWGPQIDPTITAKKMSVETDKKDKKEDAAKEKLKDTASRR